MIKRARPWTRSRRSALTTLGLMTLVGSLVAIERDARACGACFAPQIEATVVNDHRMAFAISQQHTVLWDQIEYSGDPQEFAWVLPVGRGAVVELSRDEWLSALDATTQPRIQQPTPAFSDDGCDGVGCGSSDDATSAAFAPGSEPVEVVSQSVVGPYETVTLRSEDPQALQTWLRAHGYAIPASIEPVIAAYTSQSLDFLALRLRPGQGVRAMRPVRVVTPGADPTLPLRMIAAGVGANVGLTLFVISEGRYRPQNFPEVAIDRSKLVWKSAEGRSNYQELSLATMAGAPGGRGWLVEWADRALLDHYPTSPGKLLSAYEGRCSRSSTSPSPSSSSYQPPPPPKRVPDAGADEPRDAATDAPDAGSSDAATDASSSNEPADDAGTSSADAGDATSDACVDDQACCAFDDFDLAIDGMFESSVWVTRLRANLPAAALDQDLKLEAHPKQDVVSGFYVANPESGSSASVAPLRRGRIAGSATLMLGAAFVVSRILRRRTKSG